MTSNPPPAAGRAKNGLLLLSRSWHAWAGVGSVPLVVLLAVTGVYLNHPGTVGLDPAPADDPRALTTAADPRVPVPVGAALAAARGQWGDVPVAFVQLRPDGDRLVWRVRRRGGGDEVAVDAQTGRVVFARAGEWETRFGPDGAVRTRVGWTRLMFDLHTGRVAEPAGRLVVDAAGLALLGLVGSGAYLFAVPRLRKRRSARERAAAPGLAS